jgi:signal transduction histidine kinase
MIEISPFSLLVNGFTAPLSLAFLILLVWSDLRREINSFFGVFLGFVILWNTAALIIQASLLADFPGEWLFTARLMLDIGFTGACIAAFTLTAVIVKAYTRRLRGLALLTLFTILAYRLLQLLSGIEAGSLGVDYRGQPLLVTFFLVFGGGTLLMLWQRRRAIRSNMLRAGIALFVTAQVIGLANPEFRLWDTANSLGAIAALCISFALVRQEMVRPLNERTSQVETLRRLSAAIVNQESLKAQLAQIVQRSALLVRADGAGIFIREPSGLLLIESWGLPRLLTADVPLAARSGIASKVIEERRTIHLDHYGREWRGDDDLPLAKQTFGSVICTPILHADVILGALLVVSGTHGRLFQNDDVYLLEILATQIAVSITYHQLFEQQKELDRLKNEMLRMASHDLKNPLQASMANLELLRDDLSAYPSADVQHEVEVIDKQLRRMNRIIRGVLDLEKLREGKLRVTPCTTAELIDRVMDEMREQAADHGVRLRSTEMDADSEPIELVCDTGQIQRALVNLVENAIKFTAQGGEVHLEAVRSGARVVFTVTDNGAGIDETHQPFIFDRFYRASPAGMEHVNGSGLGLSLVKAAVQNHHGDVWFESKTGMGTRFFISLPAEYRPALHSVLTRDSAADSGGVRASAG